MQETNGWLTITEAARHLKVTRRTLYRYMDAGRLPYYQIGEKGPRRVRKSDLDALLTAREGKEVTA